MRKLNDRPHFPGFTKLLKKEDSIWVKYDNVKHRNQSENDTFSTVYMDNMVTFSTITSYFHIVSLKSFLQQNSIV